jgi:uncharacterized protein YjbI with pentapeptide repeats
MANDEHLAILKRGTKVWNKWRASDSKMQPDLSGAYLKSEDLVDANLSQTNLSNAKTCVRPCDVCDQFYQGFVCATTQSVGFQKL